MKEFSTKTRSENLQKMKNQVFDLAIIGGGITGAGVARDAAQRGLSVALLEAQDFAYGTSSRSSKLVHGGIRYLENYEFGLVFEALSERTKLFKMAPHLVHPLRFMIPLFQNSRVGPFFMGLGMWLYDALALFRAPQMHEKLNAQETSVRLNILRDSDLVGSFVYSDAYMDDDRLVFETLRSAHEAGALAVNYVKVLKRSSSAHENPLCLLVQDQLTQEQFSIKAHHVVSTVGPWTDLVGETLVSQWKQILRPTKGIHLTFKKDRLPLTSAVVMAAQKSTRIVFAIPRHEMIIVGTTDTDFQDRPETAMVTAEDVRYLLQITNEYFPGAKLTEKDIISSYVGVRPLVKDQSGSEGKTSREHVILQAEPRLTFVAGGKYTTYRLMSEQIVDLVLKNKMVDKKLKKCATDQALNPLLTHERYQHALQKAVPASYQLLLERHGEEALIMLESNPKNWTLWQHEALHAIQNTMCLNLVDFYTRRVPLMLAYADHGLQFFDEIVSVFQTQFHWSDERIQLEKQNLQNFIQKELSWRTSFN